MKFTKFKLFFFLLGMCANQLCAQAFTLSFSDPIQVASGNTYGKIRPHISITADGTPLVQWGKSDGAIFVSRLVDTSFSLPLRVNPAGFPGVVLSWTGPTLAIGGDTVFVAYEHESGTDFTIYVQRSLDAGLSFSDTVRVDTLQNKIARYPFVAVGDGGTPFVSYMGMNTDYTAAEYEVAKSLDGGQTFLPGIPSSLGAPGDVCDCCTGSLAIEGNRVAQVFRNNDNNLRDIWASMSDDFGITFDTTADVDASDWTLNSCPSSGPEGFISGDSLVTVWLSAATSPSRIKMNTLHTGTMQTGPTRNLDNSGTSSQNFPAICGKGDTLGVVWDDYRNGTGDVFIRFTMNGPENFQGEGLNVIPPFTIGNQHLADVAFRNGKFHIVWMDDYQNGIFYCEGTIAVASENESPAQMDKFLIFPNPANEYLEIQYSENEILDEIIIATPEGKTLERIKVSESDPKIDVSRFPIGYYIIQLITKDEVQSKKFTIIR